MPDWSYHTLFRPVLFQLPPERARDITLGLIGWLAAQSWGPWIFEFVGHMQPPAALQQTIGSLTFPTPVGIGPGIDPHVVASAALARFGVGFVEVGPVTHAPVRANMPMVRDQDRQAISFPDLPVNDGVDQLMRRLEAMTPLNVPLGQLAPYADFFVIDTSGGIAMRWSSEAWESYLSAILPAAHAISPTRPVWLCLAPDIDRALADRLLSAALRLGTSTVVVGGGVRGPQETRVIGRPAQQTSRELVTLIRERWAERITIIGSGGAGPCCWAAACCLAAVWPGSSPPHGLYCPTMKRSCNFHGSSSPRSTRACSRSWPTIGSRWLEP
jgi:dihydroorotate dehydrogenase